ncbi:hypothetical protein SAMN04488688_10620 [Paenibacillus sp. cl141a]|uniref:hypothetical protein n=1 Tax=unclassified Paenibacillus TaxID=185978 RepID=UPI0008C76B32|nr:hypothetical protein [Paenibacillus sp. cl141a]SEL80981.1 hypothetical protein SAMN04488688_10620 [Paenibacillus sp. cl141a]
MAKTTTKLSLIKPEYSDEIEHTISALAENFQKLDDDSKTYVNTPPTSGVWPSKLILHANQLSIGGYLGWVNIRAGTAAPIWERLKSYSNGSHIVPKKDNGHYYTCIQTGYSGLTEPIFPVSNGGEVQDTRGANQWNSNHYYNVDDIVFPLLDNGRFYVCIQAGESGDVEPNWITVDGATTYDKNAVWASYRIARWKESGTAVHFRPFGKIE